MSNESTEIVTFTDKSITRKRSDGYTEIIDWDELYKVEILTTDQGPFEEDIFFLLSNKNETKGCVISQSAKGTDKLLSKLQELPNFNNEEFIKAMGSISNNRFICWIKEDTKHRKT